MKCLLRLGILFLLMFVTVFNSCKKDDDDNDNGNGNGNINVNENEEKYPITLSFKKEGDTKLEYWKGGKLLSTKLEDYAKYLKLSPNNTSDKDFQEDIDDFCKKVKIIFKDKSNLAISIVDTVVNIEYFLEADTLKILFEGKKVAFATGDKQKLKIYGTLYYYNDHSIDPDGTPSVSGMESNAPFTKCNFDGLKFMGEMSLEVQDEFPTGWPTKMDPEDMAFFYNKEYIFEP